MNVEAPREKIRLNGLLFVLTCVTVWIAGLAWAAGFLGRESGADENLLRALTGLLRDGGLYPLAGLYTVTLMTVLTGHELGHFLTCRRYGIRATWPFFLPGPPFLGTFGAFIRIKSPMFFKRQVFDVGASGPLAGFALTVPVLAAGIALSRVAPSAPADGTAIDFGEPLLFKLMAWLFHGTIPEGSGLVLHPIGRAGWVGLLVTALNLLPIGQLDGGHIAYAVLGRRAPLLSRLLVAGLLVMGVFFHVTWLVLAVVIFVFEFRARTRLRHPPVLDEAAALDRKRVLLGVLILAVFVLSFIPAPTNRVSLLDFIFGRQGTF